MMSMHACFLVYSFLGFHIIVYMPLYLSIALMMAVV